MSGDHLKRVKAWRAFSSQNRLGYDHMRDVSYERAPICDADVDALVAEVEQGRAQRRGEFRLLLAELEAAKAETRRLQACMMLVIQRYGYGGKLTFHEGDLRRAQQWLDSLTADAAPQQPAQDDVPRCGPQCSEMHTYEPGQCQAAVRPAANPASGCPCGCPVVDDMCSCPTPCPCERGCRFCSTAPVPERKQSMTAEARDHRHRGARPLRRSLLEGPLLLRHIHLRPQGLARPGRAGGPRPRRRQERTVMIDEVPPAPYTCRECGRPADADRFMEQVQQHLASAGLCFDCAHWTELWGWARAGDAAPLRSGFFWSRDPGGGSTVPVARIDGEHYTLHPDAAPGDFQGHGGRQMTALMHDGRIISSRNVWHQGTIPPRWRDRLPDNAIWQPYESADSPVPPIRDAVTASPRHSADSAQPVTEA